MLIIDELGNVYSKSIPYCCRVCNKSWLCTCILLSLRYCYFIDGLTLSPSKDVYVCLGRQLMLTCVTDGQFLEWNITIPNRNYYRLRLISSSEERDIPSLTVNYTSFSFLRESKVPLDITLTITNATIDMKIFCIEYYGLHSSNNHTLATPVDVISESDVVQYLEHFQQIMTEIASGEKNITIAILGEDLPYSVYHKNISFEMVVEPKATVIVTDEDMMVTLSYNVLYNLTVFGSLCGYTSSVNFSYANCGSPAPPINGYINAANSTRDGSEVIITCRDPQQQENYTLLIICSHDGRWEPNPVDICNQDSVESGLSKALLLVATVSCILIIIIIIFTIIPILYCYCYYRKSTRHTGEDIIPINAYTMEQEKLEEPAHSYTTII